MALSPVDTLKSVLKKLASGLSLKLIILFLTGYLILAAGYTLSILSLMIPGSEMGMAGLAAMLVSALAFLLLTAAALRASYEGSIQRKHFTDHIFKTSIKMALPFLLLGLGAAGAATSTFWIPLVTSPALYRFIVPASLLFNVIGMYLFLAIIMAVPAMSINNTKLVPALVDGFRRTKGQKIRMTLAAAPILFLLFSLSTSILVSAAAQSSRSMLYIGVGASSVVAAVASVGFVHLLVEFHRRLE